MEESDDMKGMSIIRNTTYIFIISLMSALTTGMVVYGSQQGQAEQKEIHVAVTGSDVAGKGTQDAPYATVSAAAEAAPDSIIIVHEGDYGPVQLGSECSGNEKAPTVIRPAEGEKVVIHAEDGTGLSLVNVSHIIVEGLEIEGGTHGIYYESTREAGQTLTGYQFSKLHGS